MSSDDQRITTEDLLALAQPVHVDTLTPWQGDPWQGDVGQRALQSTVFGHIGLVLTYGTDVLYGSDLVDAQRHQPDDNGLIPAVDLAQAGFTRAKAEAAALALWTNHRNATVDDVMLAELVTSLIEQEQEALQAAGWDGDDIDALLDAIGRDDDTTPGGDPDDTPDVQEGPTVTQPGDVWLLGPHRLMCGSSTDPAALATLMAGDLADALITDPPYGVDYGDTVEFRRSLGKTQRPADNSHVANDGLTEAIDLWAECFPCLEPFMSDRSAFYCWSPPGDQQIDLGLSLRAAGFETHGMIIWVKSSFSFSRADHKYQHEPAFYGWPARAVHDWHGPNNETTIWEHDKPSSSPLHPTQKPVELIQRCVRNITEKGDIVLDPFLGSGTTLVAAQAEGRTCYGMELKPAYADVICKRYQQLTGIKPVLEATGEPHDFGGDSA